MCICIQIQILAMLTAPESRSEKFATSLCKFGAHWSTWTVVSSSSYTWGTKTFHIESYALKKLALCPNAVPLVIMKCQLCLVSVHSAGGLCTLPCCAFSVLYSKFLYSDLEFQVRNTVRTTWTINVHFINCTGLPIFSYKRKLIYIKTDHLT